MNKLIIKSNIPEQEFMESMLNMKASGYFIEFPFFLYALGKRWHIDKLFYYSKLLEIKK